MQRTRHLVALAVLAIASLVSTSAAAEDGDASGGGFGARGPNVIVLDNVGGFVSYNVSDENGEHGNPTDAIGVFAYPPLTRLGYHRFFGQLSVGAGVHFSKSDVAIEDFGTGSGTIYGFAPRIGYAIPTSSTFAFWLRGGLSLTYVSGKNDTSTSYIGPAAEIFGVYTPVRNFGFQFGPVAEYGIAGSREVTNGNQTRSTDVRFRSYGFTVGLLVDF